VFWYCWKLFLQRSDDFFQRKTAAARHGDGGYKGRIGEPTDKGLIRPVYTAVSPPCVRLFRHETSLDKAMYANTCVPEI